MFSFCQLVQFQNLSIEGAGETPLGHSRGPASPSHDTQFLPWQSCQQGWCVGVMVSLIQRRTSAPAHCSSSPLSSASEVWGLAMGGSSKFPAPTRAGSSCSRSSHAPSKRWSLFEGGSLLQTLPSFLHCLLLSALPGRLLPVLVIPRFQSPPVPLQLLTTCEWPRAAMAEVPQASG